MMKYLVSCPETDMLFLCVGESEWCASDIPLELVPNIHKWTSEGVIVCTQKRNGRQRPKYKLSHDALLHYERVRIMTDPSYLISLTTSGKTLYEIQRDTGINYHKLKSKFEELSKS